MRLFPCYLCRRLPVGAHCYSLYLIKESCTDFYGRIQSKSATQHVFYIVLNNSAEKNILVKKQRASVTTTSKHIDDLVERYQYIKNVKKLKSSDAKDIK